MNEDDSRIEIDHINHNVSDNRKINLRKANRFNNQSNAKVLVIEKTLGNGDRC